MKQVVQFFKNLKQEGYAVLCDLPGLPYSFERRGLDYHIIIEQMGKSGDAIHIVCNIKGSKSRKKKVSEELRNLCARLNLPNDSFFESKTGVTIWIYGPDLIGDVLTIHNQVEAIISRLAS